MKKKDNKYLKAALVAMLVWTAILAQAQDGLHIARLFDKYGKQDKVTMVELSGSSLRQYRMTKYMALIFKDVSPYLDDVLHCLKLDTSGQTVSKRQEIVEDGQLRSGYYQLADSDGTPPRHRYILFKRGKGMLATLLYIEGPLGEEELTDMLYHK